MKKNTIKRVYFVGTALLYIKLFSWTLKKIKK